MTEHVTEHTITVVRHGATEWSLAGKHTGRTDVPLTDAGRVAAAALEQPLRAHQYALVLTSPRSRARDTAAIAGFPDAVVDEDLQEWNYGDYEGMTAAEIQRDRPEWFLWDDGVLNGETIDQVAARVDRVLERAEAATGDVLLFAHGHVLRVLAARWLRLDPEFGRHVELAPASLSVLGWRYSVPTLRVWNAPVTDSK